MVGTPNPPPFELTLLKEAQARRQIGDDRRCLVRLAGEGRGGARLVVIFEEAGELVLKVEAGHQMVADAPRMAVAQAVVEPLVVGVVEAQLLERPFQVPVDLGHEGEIAVGRDAPLRWHRTRSGSMTMPQVRRKTSGSSSIAMSQRIAVAQPGDPQQLAAHRRLQLGAAIVQLQGVGPAGKVGVATVGKDAEPIRSRSIGTSCPGARARSSVEP